jgi:hypothetical protein
MRHPERSQPAAAWTLNVIARISPGRARQVVLAGGEAMTAGQVATRPDLPRPTVSTTLPKLANGASIRRLALGLTRVLPQSGR